MDILENFRKYIEAQGEEKHNFRLFRYSDLMFIGVDNDGMPTVLCKSTRPERNPLRQKTRRLSIECNVHVQFETEGLREKMVAHVIRCKCESEKERDIFLELCPMFEEASRANDQENALLETVAILSDFFANTTEPSDIELQGLFAELYTMWVYRSTVNLGKYWQSRQRMTFDFSLTDRVKVEVKSTLKNERKHHFRHEQLAEDPYIIYIISYMMRHDDEGLSLYDLIEMVKPMINSDPRKLMAIESVVKNVSDSRLKEFRLNEDFLSSRKRIFRAKDVPKFKETTPDGVSNTEYDCNLDLADSLKDEDFEAELKKFDKKE